MFMPGQIEGSLDTRKILEKINMQMHYKRMVITDRLSLI